MSTVELDYDEDSVAEMLVALRRCPKPKRLDTLATVVKVFVESRLLPANQAERTDQ